MPLELDNANGLSKSDKLYAMRREIADQAEDRLEEYLKES